MKKNSQVRPHTFGLSLLLVVFLILCLLTFAAISITEARNDLIRSEHIFQSTKDYQDAVSFAESALRDAARDAAEDSDSAPSTLSFTVAVNDEEDLLTEAVLKISPRTNMPYYEITSFVLRSAGETEANDYLNLMTDGRIGW